jgi:hypothetical protein
LQNSNINFFAAASKVLPFGPAVLYNRKTRVDADGRSESVLERNGVLEETRRNLMDSGEAQMCQYFSLEVFPDAEYACSNFHAGPSQLTFGSNYRHKSDLMLSMVERDRDSGMSRRRLSYFNYHGQRWHDLGQHRPDCQRRDVVGGGQGEQQEPQQLLGRVARDDEDDLKRDYAEALTAVDPRNLLVTYNVVYECDLMHGKTAPDPRRWNKRLDHEAKHHKQFPSIRALLEARHPLDSVLGFRTKEYSQEGLMAKIMAGGYNSEGQNSFGGFCTITGGKESRTGDGVIPGSWGFCHQRTTLDLDQLGEFTRMQAEMMVEEAAAKGGQSEKEMAKKMLAKQLATEQTVLRRSFHEKGETISLDYLRFLVKERGLTGFKITHFIAYRCKPFMSGFMEDKLQRRYDLRDSVDPKDVLQRGLLKLTGNSIFGFMAIESSKFTTTRIMSESYLKGDKEKRKLLYSEDLMQVTILGSKEVGDSMPDLIYAVTLKNPRSEICNIIQCSSHILSASRCIFLGKILTLLRCFDPRKMEICYAGGSAAAAAAADMLYYGHNSV